MKRILIAVTGGVLGWAASRTVAAPAPAREKVTALGESPSVGASLEDFGFIVGSWSGTVKGFATPRMPKAFESPGRMTSRWGPQHAWIETESTMELPGLGPYAVKVVVRFDRRANVFDSFVVNTAGNGVRYSGKRTGNGLVFIGTIGDVTQRVTYENVSPRELRFVVEESDDGGATYRPHSETLWKRS